MVSAALGLDAAARIDLVLSDRWVAYPQGQAALRRLEELLRGARRTRMPSLLIVGDPDMGKTTILRKFMRGRSSTFDPETSRSKMEVVAIEAPPEADEVRLYSAVLEAIGAPSPSGRALETERAVHGQLRRLETRLLVIDETNNLTIGTGGAQRKTLAALRRLSNVLSLSMACFGTLEALNALTSDPQIEGRVQPFRLARTPARPPWQAAGHGYVVTPGDIRARTGHGCNGDGRSGGTRTRASAAHRPRRRPRLLASRDGGGPGTAASRAVREHLQLGHG
jgi:hypothetical protein